MNRYEDRLLELDLREVLGLESPPDVWPALAPHLASTRPRLRHLRGRRRRSPPILPWAAAAIVLLAIGLLWWATTRPEETGTTIAEPPPIQEPPPDVPQPSAPLATADAEVLIAAADGTVREGREIEAGERVAVGTGSLGLRLRDGTTLEVPGGAWFRLDDGPASTLIHVARGGLSGETGARALTVRGGPGELQVAAETRFSLKRHERPSEEHPTTWLGGFTDLEAADLVLEVEAGRVAVDALQAPADTMLVWLQGMEPRVGPVLPQASRTWLAPRLGALDAFADMAPDHPARFDADKLAVQSGHELAERLRKQPEAWAYAVPWLERRVRDHDEERAGRIALRLLVQDPDLRALPAIHDRLRVIGTDARPIELLPLAERVEDPVAIAIIHRILRERTDVFDVYPAAYLALRGDDAGRAVLERVLADPARSLSNPAASFAAAAGLHALGDPTRWNDLRRRLAIRVEVAIKTGRPGDARWPLGAASYFAPVVRTGRPVSVADLGRRLQEYLASLALDTPEALRRELRKIP